MFNINLLWHIFQFIIYLSLLMFFMYKVFENHLIISKKQFIIRTFIHVTLLTLIVCLFYTQLSPFRRFSFIASLLILALSYLMYRTSTAKNIIFLIFILFILFNVQITAFLLALATLDYHIFTDIFSYEHTDFLILSSAYCIIIFILIYVFLIRYYKRVVDDDIVIKHTKLFFCMPLLFFITLCIFAKSMSQIFSKIPKELFLPLIFLNIFALLSYNASLKSIIDNYDASVEREKFFAANNELKLWESQYENLQGKINSDARIRHDWRQHIIAIMGYVDQKDLKGLDEYLADYKEKYLIPDKSPVCDVPSLNLLFQYYQRKAEENGIDMDITPVLFDDYHISVSDFSILFGNLLENAIEACKKIPADNRYIRLKMMKQRNKIIILCENNYDGLLNTAKGEIVSRKANGGIGLFSIQGIVEKYNGQMKIENKNNIFKLYAYLLDRN